MALDTVIFIYISLVCLYARLLRRYQHANRCATWTCAIQEQISRYVGHSMPVAYCKHHPYCAQVQVAPYGALHSDNRMEVINKDQTFQPDKLKRIRKRPSQSKSLHISGCSDILCAIIRLLWWLPDAISLASSLNL